MKLFALLPKALTHFACNSPGAQATALTFLFRGAQGRTDDANFGINRLTNPKGVW